MSTAWLSGLLSDAKPFIFQPKEEAKAGLLSDGGKAGEVELGTPAAAASGDVSILLFRTKSFKVWALTRMLPRRLQATVFKGLPVQSWIGI